MSTDSTSVTSMRVPGRIAEGAANDDAVDAGAAADHG
jgi:hypothetical protein